MLLSTVTSCFVVLLSVNVPIGGEVKRVISELHPELVSFDQVRDRHTLLCKRFDRDAVGSIDQLENELRMTLRGTQPFGVQIDGIGTFLEPVSGSAPVVYLTVKSAELTRVHLALTDAFESVPGLEGTAYVPHITIARGGSEEAAKALANRDIGPISWTVNEIWLWDGKFGERIRSISLPV